MKSFEIVGSARGHRETDCLKIRNFVKRKKYVARESRGKGRKERQRKCRGGKMEE